MVMKRIILSLLLAISFSYADAANDLRYMSSIMTDCANKDKVKYIALMANINQYTDGNDTFEAIQLFADYIDKYCSNEAQIINRIASNYTQKGQAAILMQLIAMQMKNISNWFSNGYQQFTVITSEILK